MYVHVRDLKQIRYTWPSMKIPTFILNMCMCMLHTHVSDYMCLYIYFQVRDCLDTKFHCFCWSVLKIIRITGVTEEYFEMFCVLLSTLAIFDCKDSVTGNCCSYLSNSK